MSLTEARRRSLDTLLHGVVPVPDDPTATGGSTSTDEPSAEVVIEAAFRPVVCLGTRRTLGFTALARFPGSSVISPHSWFSPGPAGLGQEIELAAIRGGLMELNHLPDASFVMFKVGPVTAASRQLKEVLRPVADRIVLEIGTGASGVGQVSSDVIECLGELRAIGVRFALGDTDALDDSSNVLFDLRPDIIKIDADVTRGISHDPVKGSVASAIVSFCERAGSLSLADGVDAGADYRFLRRLGVEAGQGALFGYPTPAIPA